MTPHEVAAARFGSRSTAENVEELLGWLKAGEGFCHLRVNDGEMLCLTGLRRPEQVNGCSHHYFTDLGAELRRTLLGVAAADNGGPVNVRVGSYWQTQGSKVEDLDEAATAFVRWLRENGLTGAIPWVGSDDLVRGIEGGHTMRLFDEVRRQREGGRPVVLVGNPGIRQGAECLGAKFLDVPRYDCWRATSTLRPHLTYYASQGAIMVWCVGMSKPWIWDAWREYPDSCHLDAGHIFDAVFGDYSRAWTRRQDERESLWVAYRDQFVPYVRRFV